MKLITYTYNQETAVGILSKDEKRVYPLAELGYNFKDMNEVIERLTNKEQKVLAEKIKRYDIAKSTVGIGLDKIQLRAPIMRPKQDIVCLGLNYYDHAKESAKFNKERYGAEMRASVYFSKRVNKAVDPEGMILSHREIVQDLDYEVELAVIIGKDAYHLKADEAQEYIFGYTIINDVSARTLQMAHDQWYFGKSLEGFMPMGPWIVTASEISFPPALDLKCKVNGEERQSNNTKNMIFGIPYILEELTAGMKLEAGTIIATGTPAGVGGAYNPPKYLKKGDIVECSIEGIGVLRNEVE